VTLRSWLVALRSRAKSLNIVVAPPDAAHILIVSRPWSFPASLAPVALTGAATHSMHGKTLLH